MDVDKIDTTKREMKLKKGANFFLCVALFFAFVYGVKRVSDAAGIVDLFNPAVQAGPRAELVNLDGYRFEINQVTRQVRADFNISNKGAAPVRDIVIYCDFQDRSGEHRGGGKWVVYDTVPPEDSREFHLQDKRFISHLVTPDSIVCRAVDADGGAADAALAGKNGHH